MQRREALRLGGAGLVGTATVYGVATAYHNQSSDSRLYKPLGSVGLDGTTEVVSNDAGTIAYAATTTGYATVDISDPADPTVLADVREPLSEFDSGPLHDILDVSVSDDRLLVVGPAHGRTADPKAALLIDVSEPAAPTRLGVHETDYHIHNGILDGDYAYLCGNDMERNPLVVVDISEPADPREVARWSILDAEPAWEPVAPILRYLHDVWIADGLAVLSYWDGGTWLVDVSNPREPTFRSRFGSHDSGDLVDLSTKEIRSEQQSLPGNAHYGATDPTNSVLALGREAWSVEHKGQPTGGPGGIELYDITDLAAPQQLAAIEPPESPDPSRNGIWTSAHNFELSDDRLYSSWYDGGITIHDISDPADPTRIAAWRNPDEASFWTAQQAAAGETVVASSMGRRGSEPGIWLFPDRAGQQPDRPPLE